MNERTDKTKLFQIAFQAFKTIRFHQYFGDLKVYLLKKFETCKLLHWLILTLITNIYYQNK